MVWYGMVLFGLMSSQKPPGLYLVPELRYPCHCCYPCRCPPPCPCPPPRCHPPPPHQEVDALIILDVLAKTPGLYLVPELRYPWSCCRPCCCPPPRRCPPPRCHPNPRHHHHQEVYALDVLAKSGGPSLINGKVIAIFVKCAKVCKFVREEQKKKEEEDKPQFYSFRLFFI